MRDLFETGKFFSFYVIQLQMLNATMPIVGIALIGIMCVVERA